jgi:hypothetical protein
MQIDELIISISIQHLIHSYTGTDLELEAEEGP